MLTFRQSIILLAEGCFADLGPGHMPSLRGPARRSERIVCKTSLSVPNCLAEITYRKQAGETVAPKATGACEEGPSSFSGVSNHVWAFWDGLGLAHSIPYRSHSSTHPAKPPKGNNNDDHLHNDNHAGSYDKV